MRHLILSALLLICHSVSAEDAITISKQISDRAEQLFYTKDFDALNKLDDEYRTSQSRLPDGRWKLTFIYFDLGKVSRRGAEQEWQHKLSLVDEWVNKTPNHPAPYIAKAEILVSYAWDARGRGWAKTVSGPQWKMFHSRLTEARGVLEASVDITGKHPYWFLKMETIALAQKWNQRDFEELYNTASDMYPAYYFIHFRAADYFQPRWHGSKKKLRNFVNKAVEKSKDKEGLTLYSRIYWSQLGSLRDQTFDSGYAEWALMKQGFEDIMENHPGSIWNLNAFAYYACMAKDWETTNKLLKAIGNNPHLEIWRSKSRFYTCQSSAQEA